MIGLILVAGLAIDTTPPAACRRATTTATYSIGTGDDARTEIVALCHVTLPADRNRKHLKPPPRKQPARRVSKTRG